MDLFDKKYVYMDWDDKLKDKKVFVCDSLQFMREQINLDAFIARHVESNGDCNSLCPFIDKDGTPWSLAYYDPNYECKVAYVQGKTIQYMSVDGNWRDAMYPSWCDDCQYRVKPEEPKKKWRPYNDIAELKQAWESRWDPLVHPELFEPMIWVRDKKRPDITRLITDFNGGSESVGLAGSWIILEELFEQYEFLDGTPCGVEEVE